MTVESQALPGARIGDENPLLYFRDAQVNRKADGDGLLTEKCQFMVWRTGFRVPSTGRNPGQFTRWDP